eukprot:764646-Lingulodinium_polyedra.AAC.1
MSCSSCSDSRAIWERLRFEPEATHTTCWKQRVSGFPGLSQHVDPPLRRFRARCRFPGSPPARAG